MTNIEKEIEELEKIANSDSDRPSAFEAGIDCGARGVAQEALLIIKELRQQNQKFIEVLRLIACDDGCSRMSIRAHKVLKQFGKL